MKNVDNYPCGKEKTVRKQLQLLCRRAIVIIVLLTIASGVFAQVAPVNPPTNGFDIDGNLRANFTTINIGDWVAGPQGSGGYVFNVTAAGVPTVVAGLNGDLKRDPYNDRNDIIFTEGSKFNADPNSWAWSVSKAPNKNDINNAMYLVTRSANNHDWIIIGGDRLSTSGTSYIDFELLQKPLTRNGANGFTSEGEAGGRTVGDLVVSMEYSNGGTKPVVRIYRWQEIGAAGSKVYDYVMANADLSAFVFAETNRTGAVDVPFRGFGSTTYSQYAFVEAAVDVTGILSELADPCTGLSIKTIFIKTKASDSQTAALKDMVEPVPVSIDFGSATIAYGGPFCPTGTASVTQTGVTGGTYSALPEGLSINTSSGAINLAASSPGSYTVTYTYTTNNCVKTTTAPVVINATPAQQTLTGGTYCEGAAQAGAEVTIADTESGVSYQLQVRSGTSPSYSWSNVGTAVTGDGNAATFGVRPAGVYQVVATGAAPSSCTNTFGNAEVTMVNRPIEQVLSGGAYCSGANPAGAEVKLADTESGVAYQLQVRSGTDPNFNWTNVTNALQNGTGEEVSFGILSVGVYRVVATSTAPGSCTRTFGNAAVTEVTPPAAQTLNGGSYCSGASPAGAAVTLSDTENGVSYQLQVRSGTDPNYTWSNVGSAITGDGNQKSFGLQLVGVYQVVATGAAPTRCTSTFGNATVSLSQNPSPPTVVYNAPACDSDKFSLTITGVSVGDRVTLVDKNGAPISGALPASPYTVKNTDLIPVNGSNVVGFNYTNIPAGSGYGVSVTTAAGCTSGTNSCPAANGLAEVSKTKSQSFITEADQVTAYPVPFYDTTTIEFKAERSGKYTINLYDMKGKLVRELKSGNIKAGETKAIEVDGRELAEGMYLARIVSEAGAKTVKLLKRK